MHSWHTCKATCFFRPRVFATHTCKYFFPAGFTSIYRHVIRHANHTGQIKNLHFQMCQVWKSICIHLRFAKHKAASAIQMASITRVSRSSSLICIFNVFWKLLLLFCCHDPNIKSAGCNDTGDWHTGPKTFYEFLLYFDLHWYLRWHFLPLLKICF